MKTMKKFLSMTALALVGAMITGCSSDDNIIDNPQQPENKSNVETLTTTVGLDGSGEAGVKGITRALTSGGVKTFAAGETMAVIYNNGTSTVKAVSHELTTDDLIDGGTSATFTFDLETPNKEVNVTYIYPAAMANSDGSINYAALNSQNGTLATLASNLDLATYSGAWNAGTLPTGTLTNQLAILAITLKNSTGASEITSSITGMTISDGTYNYAVSRSAAAGPIYVAIRPTASANIEVTATDGSTDYTKSLTDKTYAAGNGYNVSWKMAPAGPTAYSLAESTVGMIVGSDGKAYAVADKDNLPSGVTAVAMVAYKSANAGESLAIALSDEDGGMNWSEAESTCWRKDKIGGNSWKLPSEEEWNQMFGADVNADEEEYEVNYTDLKTAITNAGGTALIEIDEDHPYAYWSSTPGVKSGYRLVVFSEGVAYWQDFLGNGMLVRAVLAF